MGHHRDTYVERAMQTLNFGLQRDFTPDNADKWDNIARDVLTEARTHLIFSCNIASRLTRQTDWIASTKIR